MRTIILLACLSMTLAFAPDDMQRIRRIVGGQKSKRGSRPYMVSVQWTKDGWSSYCGGALVHPKWVVTSAHCSTTNMYVGLGYTDLRDTKGIQIVRVLNWIPHPEFDVVYYENDIALIELPKAVTLNDKIQTIDIHPGGAPEPGTQLMVSGWGSLDVKGTLPYILREVVVDAINIIQCESMFEDLGYKKLDNVFCAYVEGGGRDACQSDTGGPIVSNFAKSHHKNNKPQLEGIVSWGESCGGSQYPGVYTHVASYCDWLNEASRGDITC